MLFNGCIGHRGSTGQSSSGCISETKSSSSFEPRPKSHAADRNPMDVTAMEAVLDSRLVDVTVKQSLPVILQLVTMAMQLTVIQWM